MNNLSLKNLDLDTVEVMLDDLITGKGDTSQAESLLRFAEYNRSCLEKRLEQLWGIDNVRNIYTAILKALISTWYRQRDVRFLSIVMKLNQTKFFRARCGLYGLEPIDFIAEIER